MSEVQVGDLVWVGSEGDLARKIVWQIESIHDGNAVVRSGMTERRSVFPIERLTPFKPRQMEPA